MANHAVLQLDWVCCTPGPARQPVTADQGIRDTANTHASRYVCDQQVWGFSLTQQTNREGCSAFRIFADCDGTQICYNQAEQENHDRQCTTSKAATKRPQIAR